MHGRSRRYGRIELREMIMKERKIYNDCKLLNSSIIDGKKVMCSVPDDAR